MKTRPRTSEPPLEDEPPAPVKEWVVCFPSGALGINFLQLTSDGPYRASNEEEATRFTKGKAKRMAEKYAQEGKKPPKIKKVGTPPVEEEEKPFSNDVDLAWFENGLKIDKYALDEGLVEQPETMQRACERYAMAISRRDWAKDLVKQTEAKLYLRIRDELTFKGEKMTEALLSAMVDAHEERAKAVREWVDAAQEATRWEGMKDSYKDRGYALKELSALHLASYFAKNSAEGSAHQIRQHEYESDKARIREGYRKKNAEKNERSRR
jgi:hypothetical protein